MNEERVHGARQSMTIQDNGTHPHDDNPWHTLPQAMRDRPQWLLAAPDAKGALKLPTTIDDYGDLQPGSSTDPSTWLDFALASAAAQARGLGLGYVLSDGDPFTCIDFDVKNASNELDPAKHTSPAHVATMQGMVEDLASYTELSQSGQGVHVWVEAKFAGEGAKHKGVEVYCRDRFMACTGRSIHGPALPIVQQQEEVEQLIANIREAQAATSTRASGLADGESDLDDAELMARAWDADNCDKFRALWAGQWQELGYISQSEGDLALIAMLCFYSRDNEQVKSLFRRSGLGMREKAVKDDRYLNYTLRLVRGRQAKEDAWQQQVTQQAAAVLAQVQQQPQQPAQAAPGAPQPAGQPLPQPHGPGAALPAAFALPPGVDALHPPGMLGRMAEELAKRQSLPIQETAVMAVTSWLAGVCGLAYVTQEMPGSTPTGLNAYEVLAARTGVGKEQLVVNLGLLQRAAREGLPMADAMVDQINYSSAPGLLKALVKQHSLLNMKDEWGDMLVRMTNPKDAVAHQLKSLLNSLYMKSSPSALALGTVQSEQSHTVSGSVAFSLCGTTTPDGLLATLTPEMMSGGFLSRFSIRLHNETKGARKKNRNSASHGPLPEGMCALLRDIALTAVTALANKRRVTVRVSEEAERLLVAFDDYCGARIVGDDEAVRQIWNRAHLKVIRLACRAAILDNHTAPTVQPVHVQWAVAFVMEEVAMFLHHYAAGDVGNGDEARAEKVLGFMRDWLKGDVTGTYDGIPPSMRGTNCVPRAFLQYRVNKLAAFKDDGYKKTKDHLNETLRLLQDDGKVAEVPKQALAKEHEYGGKAYRLMVA